MKTSNFSDTVGAVRSPAALDANDAAAPYLLRQPVSDREQKLLGYELRWSQATAADKSSGSSDLTRLLDRLNAIDPARPLGDKALVFADCTDADLALDLQGFGLADRVVLQLPKLAPAHIAAALPRLQRLRDQGFHLALGAQALHPAYASWMPLVEFVFLDASAEPTKVALAIKQLGQSRKINVIAQRVVTRELCTRAIELGFGGLMGPYFAQMPASVRSAANPAQATLIQLIALVQREADVSEIEQVLRHDPALSFKMLRYVNSAGFGTGREISSFGHAVMLMGYKPLVRWLTMVLATVTDGSGAGMLSRMAVVRARLLELLAQDAGLAAEKDNAFILGAFSLMDVMLRQPLDRVLKQVVLPEAVRDALLHRAGSLGTLLRIAENCERWVTDTATPPDDWMGMAVQSVTERHLEALAWSESLGI